MRFTYFKCSYVQPEGFHYGIVVLVSTHVYLPNSPCHKIYRISYNIKPRRLKYLLVKTIKLTFNLRYCNIQCTVDWRVDLVCTSSGWVINVNVSRYQRRLYIVASELKDSICHSNECQIGSFSSEATIYIRVPCINPLGPTGGIPVK